MKPKLLILDNYDSFTYNLYQYALPYCASIEVIRNDKIRLTQVTQFDKIILSPGPGLPKQAGKMMALIDQYFEKKPILGVCLGMQAIGQYFGAKLENLKTVYHGIQSTIAITDPQNYIYHKIPASIDVGRYHSWVVSRKLYPNNLQITSIDEHKHIMSLKHKRYDIQGIQYHPESVMTKHGKAIIKNWIQHPIC